MKEMMVEIQNIRADLGGTNILSPLQTAVDLIPTNREKRIFLLTDGQVGGDESYKIRLFAQEASSQNKARIHTFGIGRDFDRQLVEETAKAGRGTCNFAQDTSNLATLVVEALRKSFEPSLANCVLSWNNAATHLNEMFRD